MKKRVHVKLAHEIDFNTCLLTSLDYWFTTEISNPLRGELVIFYCLLMDLGTFFFRFLVEKTWSVTEREESRVSLKFYT